MRTDFTQELRELRGPSYALQGWEEIVLWWLLPCWGIYQGREYTPSVTPACRCRDCEELKHE